MAILSFQFVIHALNHLKDIDGARPDWLGVANFVALAAGALLLIWLLRYALSEKRTRP